MVHPTVVDALGSHARRISPLLVEAVLSRHERFAEAHEVSGTRYLTSFGAQWRDLLVDVETALGQRGYQTCKVLPAGYQLPVVNECLVFVWRVPGHVGEVSAFAASPSRRNAFSCAPPDPMLFDPGFIGELDAGVGALQAPEVTGALKAAAVAVMPLVLVVVRSSPRQLQSIEWGVAELDQDSGAVRLHGQEILWSPETAAQEPAGDLEAFDSGVPHGPNVEARRAEETPPHA